MLAQFARLVGEIFPSVSPDTTRECIAAIKRETGTEAHLYASTFPRLLMQGDVIEPIVFFEESETGALEERVSAAMILSHSCDYDNDEFVVVAECLPWEAYRGVPYAASLRVNQIYNLFFLPHVPSKGKDMVVDLTQLRSIRTAVVKAGVADGSIRRLSSFSPIGHWVFIGKVSLHFLRPQSPTEARGAYVKPSFRRRLRYALARAAGAVRYVVDG